jgi:hypothetical protein
MPRARHAPLALLAAATTLALSACRGNDAAAGRAAGGGVGAGAAGDVVVADVGLSTPESVLHDTAADVYLVSNINGSAVAEDDNGFISRVTPDGAVLELKWIDGADPAVVLNAPKGMALSDGTLYVADITCVRRFDAGTGAPQGEICPMGTTFLNDVASGSDGTVWFTDSGLVAGPLGLVGSGTDAVYRYLPERDSLTVVAMDPSLGSPNGIAVGSQGALVVTYGSGEAYRLDAAGERTPVLPPSRRQFDGVVLLPDGGFLATSWSDQCVYRVGADGILTKALEGVEAPADLGWDAARMRMLVPLFNANRIVIHPLG